MKLHFWQFLTFSQFKNWFLVIFKMAKNGFWSKYFFVKLIDLIPWVFLAWTFLIFWPTVHGWILNRSFNFSKPILIGNWCILIKWNYILFSYVGLSTSTYALMIFQNKKVFSSQMSSEKFKDQKSKGKRDLQGFFKVRNMKRVGL